MYKEARQDCFELMDWNTPSGSSQKGQCSAPWLHNMSISIVDTSIPFNSLLLSAVHFKPWRQRKWNPFTGGEEVFRRWLHGGCSVSLRVLRRRIKDRNTRAGLKTNCNKTVWRRCWVGWMITGYETAGQIREEDKKKKKKKGVNV